MTLTEARICEIDRRCTTFALLNDMQYSVTSNERGYTLTLSAALLGELFETDLTYAETELGTADLLERIATWFTNTLSSKDHVQTMTAQRQATFNPWVPNDVDGGWDCDAGAVQLSVRPLESKFHVSWHVHWLGDGDESARHDSWADNFDAAKRQAIDFALRKLKESRAFLLAARQP